MKLDFPFPIKPHIPSEHRVKIITLWLYLVFVCKSATGDTTVDNHQTWTNHRVQWWSSSGWLTQELVSVDTCTNYKRRCAPEPHYSCFIWDRCLEPYGIQLNLTGTGGFRAMILVNTNVWSLIFKKLYVPVVGRSTDCATAHAPGESVCLSAWFTIDVLKSGSTGTISVYICLSPFS